MKISHPRIIRLILCLYALGGSITEARNRPTSLMTELMTGIGSLYRCELCNTETLSGDVGQDFAVVHASRPTFGWIVPDCGPGTHRLSYRIIASDNATDSRSGRGNIRNSGTIRSRQSVAVTYGGEALKPNKLCFWRVAVSTDTGGDSERSEIEPFRTAEQPVDYAPSYRPQRQNATSRPT